MIFCHVRAWNQDDGFAYEAELADAAGTGTADNQVGSLVSCAHVADEVHHLEHGQVRAVLQPLVNRGVIVLARLPDKLHSRRLNQVEVLHYALVHSPCAEASANDKYRLLVLVEAERAQGLGLRHLRVEQSLAHGVARLYDFVGREEAFHAVVGHAYTVNLLGEYLVRHAGIRVLLLYEAWNAPLGALVKHGATGVTAHPDGSHRPEVAYYLLGHTLAFPYLEEHGYVLQHVLPVEAADGQADDTVSRVGHALHLHTPESAHEKDVGVGILGPYGVGYGNGGEYMASRTASADDDSEFILHKTSYLIIAQK